MFRTAIVSRVLGFVSLLGAGMSLLAAGSLAQAGVFSVHEGFGFLAIAHVDVWLLAATSRCSCAGRRGQSRIGAGDAPRAAGCSVRRRRLRCRTAKRAIWTTHSMNRSSMRGRRAAAATPPLPDAAASIAFVRARKGSNLGTRADPAGRTSAPSPKATEAPRRGAWGE